MQQWQTITIISTERNIIAIIHSVYLQNKEKINDWYCCNETNNGITAPKAFYWPALSILGA